jgi:hypothetical protein
MGFKRSEYILQETKTKRIYFGDQKADYKYGEADNRRFLDITYRIHAMSHGRKQRLMSNVFSIQEKAKRIKEIQKVLEDKNRPAQDREAAQDETSRIMQDVQLLIPPLVDYLGGTPDSDPPRPPAIVSWDLLGDDNQPLAITRFEIEELDEEAISKIAWELLGDSSPGESNALGSSPQSGAVSQEQKSTVPA